MIMDWMSTFGPRLLSCAFQVAIFALIVSLLCIRTWTPKGPNIPLMGLLAILVLTLGKFVPLPGWTNNSLNWVERKILVGNTRDSTSQSRPQVQNNSVHRTTPFHGFGWRILFLF